MMPWEYSDGGRADAGFKGEAGDCVTRSIAIATGRPYRVVYDELGELVRAEQLAGRTKKRSARNGVPRRVIRAYLDPDYEWTPLMGIGTGCTVHVRPDELPAHGAFILSLSKHLTALIDGVIYDTHDPSRDGQRCVYGMWKVSE